MARVSSLLTGLSRRIANDSILMLRPFGVRHVLHFLSQMVKDGHTLSPKLHFLTFEKNALCAALLPLNIGQQPVMNIIRHNLLTYEHPMSSMQQPAGGSVEMIHAEHFPPNRPTYRTVERID